MHKDQSIYKKKIMLHIDMKLAVAGLYGGCKVFVIAIEMKHTKL